MFSLKVLPIVVSIGVWWLPSSYEKSQLKLEYTQLAVNILQSEISESSSTALRQWAVEVFSNPLVDYQIPESAKNELINGKTIFKRDQFIADLMEKLAREVQRTKECQARSLLFLPSNIPDYSDIKRDTLDSINKNEKNSKIIDAAKSLNSAIQTGVDVTVGD